MSQYVVIRMPIAQAFAACNASDLIRDQYEANGEKREAAVYQRASGTIQRAIDVALGHKKET